MVYLGRVILLGLALYADRPFAGYALSARSPPNKQRRIRIDKDCTEAHVEPLGEPTPEQEANRDLIFYDAIKIFHHISKVVLANGIQSECMCYEGMSDDLGIAHGFIETGGTEDDKYRTPRIAATLEGDGKACMGIVTKEGLMAQYIEPKSHRTAYVSTYKGDLENNRKIVIPELKIPVDYTDSMGEPTVQGIADNIYDWMDSDFVIATAAVLWDPDKKVWRMAGNRPRG